MPGGREYAGTTGVKYMVGTVGLGFCGPTGGGRRVRIEGWGGRKGLQSRMMRRLAEAEGIM